MGLDFKETSFLKTDQKKYSENYDAIDWDVKASKYMPDGTILIVGKDKEHCCKIEDLSSSKDPIDWRLPDEIEETFEKNCGNCRYSRCDGHPKCSNCFYSRNWAEIR
jgi:hypothetical protein